MEYYSLKRKLNAIEAKRNAMIQKLQECRAQLARIRTLPQEVLGYIFLFYMDDPSHSPWTLMQITRTWRATALSTRGIWAKIMLTSVAWQKVGSSRRKEGREVCGSKEQLDRALRRAGNAPLDLSFSFTSPYGSQGRQYDRKGFWAMMDVLASSSKCLQVVNLEIHGPCAFYLNSRPKIDPLRFPELRTLRVTSPYCSTFVEKVSASSTRVTELHVVAPRLLEFGAATAGFEQFMKYPTVVSLTLDGREVRRRNGPSMQALENALNNAQFITTLDLSSVCVGQDPVGQMIRLPSLRTLRMRKSSMTWSFDAPQLVELELIDGSYIQHGPAGSNNFPLLASFTISAFATWGRPDYITALHFPPLHTLDLCFGGRNGGLTGLMLHSADLNPVVFKLRRTPVSTTYLTMWIASMDRLEELELDEVAVKKRFFEFLTIPRDVNPDGEVLLHCPRLIRLSVDLKGGSVVQNRSVKVTAKKAAKARIQAGLVVEKWVVQSPSG